MFEEEDLLPISALQHVVFCERQFALIHVEGVWIENVLTTEGRELHERVEAGESDVKMEIRIARELQVRSLAAGLIGKTDVVEFHPDPLGAAMEGWPGRWRPFPVEYKRGKPKEHRADEVQLCAQAVCLEEMLGCEVPRGALYYGRIRRRTQVDFDEGLRKLMAGAATRSRELLTRAETPRARREPKCERCSLLEICRPETLARSATGYIRRSIADSLDAKVAGSGG